MKRLPEYCKYFAVFLLLLILDQTTKHLAFSGKFGSFLNGLKPVFWKEIFQNYNFAFSLDIPYIVMFVVYLILIFGLVYFFIKRLDKTTKMKYILVLVLAGALSNILDRLMLGYVRDFIGVFWGNIFNLADVFIVAGVVLLLLEPRESAKI